MQPSSLIFVAVVAVWAAYLLQHWIRRREALVTARSVDQFSEAMRVLDHDRSAGGTAPGRRTVHQAESTAAPASTPRPRTSLRAGTVMTGEPQTHRPEDAEAVTAASPGLGSRIVHALAGLNSRRVRGISLLAALVLLVFAVATAPFGIVPWWAPLVSLMLVAGVFAWLRKEAVAEQQARQASRSSREASAPTHRRRIAPATARAAVRPHAASATKKPSSKEPSSKKPAAENPVTEKPLSKKPAAENPAAEPETAAHGPSLGHVSRPEVVFDVAAADRAEAPTVATHEPVDGEWSPVPVPRPTYTMKAKAPQRVTEPAPIDTPVDELPFDGMALDEELEELPSAFRAG